MPESSLRRCRPWHIAAVLLLSAALASGISAVIGLLDAPAQAADIDALRAADVCRTLPHAAGAAPGISAAAALAAEP